MAAFASRPAQSPSADAHLGYGMEQFHHPRPVRIRDGALMCPTPQRELLLRGLTGRVAELGAGDGVKLTCYPAQVQEITLVEEDPFLLEIARAAAADIPVAAHILAALPANVPVPDGVFDAVVCSLVLCSAPDPQTVLTEARRILRPGGELRFYEHVRSSNPALALTEAMLTPLWSRAAGGCHPARDTLSIIRQAGFTVQRVHRFAFDHVSHVLGTAHPV
ncbi:class I SAM-dependent methyltransferase [Streptosporangium canum]|uniref:class I SAM-dependent methyltransferase n=1 Tax=Streptosporangium canum TaxID=324952 RepID=UPI003797AF4D